MKKFLLVQLAGLLLFAGVAVAQTEELPDPGITPDSPLYFFDTLGENFGLLFAFSDEQKVQKSTEIAGEKAAEIRAMVEKGDEDATEKAAERYGEVISTAAESLAAAARSGEGFDGALAELVAQAISIHLSVLADVYDKVPEQAKGAIESAMQHSERGANEAINALGGEERPDVEQIRQDVQQKVEEAQQKRGGPEGIVPGSGAPEGVGNGGGQSGGAPQNIPGGRP